MHMPHEFRPEEPPPIKAIANLNEIIINYRAYAVAGDIGKERAALEEWYCQVLEQIVQSPIESSHGFLVGTIETADCLLGHEASKPIVVKVLEYIEAERKRHSIPPLVFDYPPTKPMREVATDASAGC